MRSVRLDSCSSCGIALTPSSPNSIELTTRWLRYHYLQHHRHALSVSLAVSPASAMIDATQWLDCADRLALLTCDEARRIAVNIAKPRSCNDENNGPDQQDKNRKASRQVQALCRTVSWTGNAIHRPTRADTRENGQGLG